jgi:ATP-dependent Zn protease
MKQEKQYLNIILLIFAASMIILMFVYYTNRNMPPHMISYTEFRQHVEEGQVSKVVFNGQQIDGTFDPPLVIETASDDTQTTTSSFESSTSDFAQATETAASEATKIESFRTYLPPIPDNELLDLLKEKEVTIETRAQGSPSGWASLLGCRC